jgi:deoxycytidylate deaminase
VELELEKQKSRENSKARRRFAIKATTFDVRGRMISIGYNSYSKTHPQQARLAKMAGLECKQHLHAEVAAIIKSRDRKIHKIKIERYDSQGNPRLAAPCPVCQMAISMAGISVVEYTVG